MVLLIVVFAVVFLVWAAIELLAIAGLIGAASNERLERCPRCGRLGFTDEGTRHPEGCPVTLSAHLRSASHLRFGRHHLAHR